MKIREIIRRFDTKRENRIPAEEKGEMILALDRRVYSEILLPCKANVTPPEYSADFEELEEKEALIKDGFEEIYLLYLAAQCSLAEADMQRYNTDIQEYMRLLREYQAHCERSCGKRRNRLSV